MPLPSLNSVVVPSLPLSFDETPRVLGVDFGNGYTQRAADGINSLDQNMELVWDPITAAEKDQVLAFLRARNGVSAFSYTLDGLTRTFTAPTWSSTKNGAGHYVVKATLKRVFD